MTIWEKLYQAYEEWNCGKFKEYRTQLTEDDKKSPYFLYYEKLRVKLCKEQVKSKILLKWKVIKCPSCGAPLTLTEYNKLQIKKLTQWAQQVTFVCGYCWNEFVYSRKPFKTIFSGYKVGQEIELNWKKYKLAGAVRYSWKYEEWWESWKLKYIEWLAYDEKWNIYYISESRAKDSRWVYDEYEISQKINFPFLIQWINQNEILTSKNNYNVDEYDEVEVKSVIWQVNKWYKIWEKVRLWKFWDYNLEEEKGENTVERNLYKNVSAKKIKSENIKTTNYKFSNEEEQNLVGFSIFVLLILLSICPMAIFFFLFLVLFYLTAKNKTIKNIIIFIWIISFVMVFLFCVQWSWGSYSWWSYSSWWWSSYWGGK